jgi:hypothetical protein
MGDMMRDIALIASHEDVLLADEMPILFTGLNALNDRVLGSFHRLISGGERYLHVIVRAESYRQFRLRRVTYRQILESCADVFTVDRFFRGPDIAIRTVRLSDLPKTKLPSEDSFSPAEPDLASSAGFSAHLTGSKANQHRAPAETLAGILEGINSLARRAVEVLLGSRDGTAEVHALKEGSFDIQFSVVPRQETMDTQIERDRRNEALGQYVQLATERFIFESEAIGQGKSEAAPCFYSMIDHLSTMRGLNVAETTKTYKSALPKIRTSVRDAADQFADVGLRMGDAVGVEAIEFFNLNEPPGRARVLSTVTNKAASELKQAVADYDRRQGYYKTTEDRKARRILVYHLNTKSGNGAATLMHGDEEYAVKLVITGETPIGGSILTRSMHRNEFVTVPGAIVKIGDEPKELHIDLGIQEAKARRDTKTQRIPGT